MASDNADCFDWVTVIGVVLLVLSLLTLIGCGYVAIWSVEPVASIVGKLTASAVLTAVVSGLMIVIGTGGR
jgi:hypothetical protein